MLLWFARRGGLIAFDPRLGRSAARLVLAGLVLALALWLVERPLATWLSARTTHKDEAELAMLVAIGAAVYGATVLALFGKDWLARFRGRATATAGPRPDGGDIGRDAV